MPSGVKFITNQHREAFRHGARADPRLRRQEDRDHAGLAEAVGGIFEQ